MSSSENRGSRCGAMVSTTTDNCPQLSSPIQRIRRQPRLDWPAGWRDPLLRASRLRQQYRNEIPQHHHCDSPTSLVGCSPHVLSHEYRCGCAKFGTKRPRVQILSPRPVFPQVRFGCIAAEGDAPMRFEMIPPSRHLHQGHGRKPRTWPPSGSQSSASTNHARNGRSRGFHAGFGRSSNPQVVDSSPTGRASSTAAKYSSGAVPRRSAEVTNRPPGRPHDAWAGTGQGLRHLRHIRSCAARMSTVNRRASHLEGSDHDASTLTGAAEVSVRPNDSASASVITRHCAQALAPWTGSG